MFTYLVLNLVFLFVVYAVLRVVGVGKLTKPIVITIGILLVFTAIFDSFIVGLDIVRYDEAKILGAMIGTAPIEDFFYALLAGILVPSVWQLLERHHEPKN